MASTTPCTCWAAVSCSVCTPTPPTPTDPFDEHRTGLDHVAFSCQDGAELLAWADRLDELGIGHGAVKEAAYGSGLSFRDPDGIALEFFAPPAPR